LNYRTTCKGKVSKYREIAQKAGEVWKEHGALEY
jgi:uncharacterized protein YbaA (DUF1428 family)